MNHVYIIGIVIGLVIGTYQAYENRKDGPLMIAIYFFRGIILTFAIGFLATTALTTDFSSHQPNDSGCIDYHGDC